MKKLPRLPNSLWLTRAAAGLAAVGASEGLQATPLIGPGDFSARQSDAHGRFDFAYDHVLGTSLDLQLETASRRDAQECERRVLAEIDRLENVLSIYRPTSEISRVKAGAPVESPALADVLAAYELWSARTGGALSANMSAVVSEWRDAARLGRTPESAALAAAFATPRALNVDALGKSYIVDRAVAVAREFAAGGLLNIGGDLRAWGDTAWMIDVANPLAPADNAPPLTRFPLRNAAVATSGGYARHFTVAGRHYSHLIDPRTQWPIARGRAATAVASDCVTANALATALCVLDASEGAKLARAFALDHLSFAADDNAGLSASGGFASLGGGTPSPLAADTPVAAADAWPTGYKANITVSLKSPEGFRIKRPYVAVWVENADHKLVRTLTVWGNGRYQTDLTKWWRAIDGNRFSAGSVTRATRYPGAYTVTWDGRDSRGQAVPQGDYTIWVEINREHGHHVWETVTVKCGADAVSGELHETAESDAGPVEYGPAGR